MKNEWDTWNDMSDAERMRAWWSIRDALRVYGGHIPPCKGRPCECGFREAWKMAGLPVTTSDGPTDAELAEQPCQLPNCGCPEARLCMGKGGPNSGAYALINRPSKVR